MAKIRKSFYEGFKKNLDVNTEITKKKDRTIKFYTFILDIASRFFKIVLYILICLLISLGATAIFNSNIREMILQIIR